VASNEEPGGAEDPVSGVHAGGLSGLAGEQTEAAAENSTQAAKNLYPGQVSVNLQTGAASVQFSVPAFAGLSLALSYSSIAARYDSPFMLPAGVNLMGIPFVYTSAHVLALNLNGQDYYVDDRYASILTEGGPPERLYYSGLKYQASRNILFEDHGKTGTQKTIRAHGRDQRVTECTARYELQVYDNAGARTTFFFDEDGFCIFVVSKYFRNDTPFNYKYVVSLAYDKSDPPDVRDSKLQSITDTNGNRMEVSYENRNWDVRFRYPSRAPGQTYEVYALGSSSAVVLGHSLDAACDYQLVIDTDDPLSRAERVIEEVIYEKESGERHCNKRYLLTYTQDEGVAMVSSLAVIDGKEFANVVTTDYVYSGDRQQTFDYGYDRAFDAPDVDTSRVCYETRVVSGRNQTRHSYNELSQEIRTEIRSPFGDLITEVHHIYPPVVAYDPASRTNRFLANYQFPSRTLALVYDRTSKGAIEPVGVWKKECSYGDFGNLLREASYPTVQFAADASRGGKGTALPDYPTHLSPVTETSNRYDDRYMMLIEQSRTDHTMDKVDTVENRLTPDGLNVVVTMAAASNIAGDKKQQLHSTEYGYAHDGETDANSNFVDASTILWGKEYFPGDDETGIFSEYSYNLSDGGDPRKYGTLAVKKRVRVKSADNVPEAVTTEYRIDGLTVREIGATDLVVDSCFDVSRNLVSRTCPAGVTEEHTVDYVERTYRSEIVDANGNERYLRDFRQYDFINQLLRQEERCEKNAAVSSYTVAATTYDYRLGGLADKRVDANGNQERFSYDDYRCLLQRRSRYQKNGQGALEHFGDTEYRYSIGWFENGIRNCYVIAEEVAGGALGFKTVTKALNKDIIYERCTWAGGALKSKLVNDVSLSGVLLSEMNYVPGERKSDMQLQSHREYHYDLLGRTERISQELFDAAGTAVHRSSVAFQYDRWNVSQEVQRKFLTGAVEISTYRLHYDLLGKEIAKSYRTEGRELSTRVTYSAIGDVLQSRDFNGNVTERSYDQKTGLPSSTRFKDGAGLLVDSVGNVYDAFARMVRQVAGDSYGVEESVNAIGLSRSLKFLAPAPAAASHQSKAEILYDDQNRVARYSNADGLSFTFTYLPSGNVDRVRIEGAQSEEIGTVQNEYYGYEPSFPLRANRPKSSDVRFHADGIAFSQTSACTYDEQGRLHEASCDDGTRRMSTSYVYNKLDQVIGRNHCVTALATQDVAARVEYAYRYNERDQLMESVVNDLAGSRRITRTYVYDDFGNINEQHTICEGGNSERVDVTFTYNGINQLLEKRMETLPGSGPGFSETASYHYDDNGNVIRETIAGDGAGHVAVDYVYNAQNQLVSVASNQGTSRYSYYPTGQRATKQKDGRCLLFYYDTAGKLCNSMLVDGAGDPAACRRDSYFGRFRYIRGGVAELQAGDLRLNSSNGTTIARPGQPPVYQTQSVSDYGKVGEGIAAGEDPFGYMQYPFLYGAAHYDAETGLQYMQSRYYSPAQERFLAQDSADFEDLPNRYTYALSNPVMNYDQNGHKAGRGWAIAAATVLTIVGLVASPATAGASEALAVEADTLLLTAADVAATAEERALAKEGLEALSMGRQVGGNAAVFSGVDGLSNVYQQAKEGNDFSWANFGTALIIGAVSGGVFGGMYGIGVKSVSELFGPLRRTRARAVNAALYTVANVYSHVIDTAGGTVYGISDEDGAESALKGLVFGVVEGSLLSKVSVTTLARRAWAGMQNLFG
jgi:RHS repeat-associated protein